MNLSRHVGRKLSALALALASMVLATSASKAVGACDPSDYRTTISDVPCEIPESATFPLQTFAHFNDGTVDANLWTPPPPPPSGHDHWEPMPPFGTVDSFVVKIPGGGSVTVREGESAYLPIPGTNCTLRVDYQKHGSTTTPPGGYLCPHLHIIAICPPCGEEYLPDGLARKETEISLFDPKVLWRP